MEFLEQVLQKYPENEFLQVLANLLLNLKEELKPITRKETKFEYPPFQKALPYFPYYGNQVTLVFQSDLTPKIQKAIIGLLHALNGKF